MRSPGSVKSHARRHAAARYRRFVRMPPRRIRPTLTQVILASVLMAMLITPLAVAQSGDNSRVTKNDARYAFLARNTNQGDGGAGAFACQSDANPAGQTNREPCLNMVNKGTGFAAAFRTRGVTGFRLQTSGSGEATPFLLDSNATGVVRFLNADLLDGLSVEQIRPRFARINFSAPDQVAIASGANGATEVSRTSAGRYQVKFDRDVSACAYNVTSTQVGQARTVAAAPLSTDPTKVDVAVRPATGTDEGEVVDGSFYVTVNC